MWSIEFHFLFLLCLYVLQLHTIRIRNIGFLFALWCPKNFASKLNRKRFVQMLCSYFFEYFDLLYYYLMILLFVFDDKLIETSV